MSDPKPSTDAQAHADEAQWLKEAYELEADGGCMVGHRDLALSRSTQGLREQVAAQQRVIAALREGITQVLGTGLPSNSIVFAQDQWSKGYCAGVTAALTAFDTALAKQFNPQKEG